MIVPGSSAMKACAVPIGKYSALHRRGSSSTASQVPNVGESVRTSIMTSSARPAAQWTYFD